MDATIEKGGGVKKEKMERQKTIVLFAIALLAVIALTGSAAADPAGGQVNSTTAEGQIVTLYLDTNPGDYVTTAVINNASGGLDYYYFDSIASLLDRNGYSLATSDPYNATIEMRCSGYERNIDGGLGNPYTNTLKNTTPTTAHIAASYDGNTDAATLMELEPCAVTEESFSKSLYEGWNLVSLPLIPEDNTVSAVLPGVSYDAVYRFNAASKQFESVTAMDLGIGYFVHITTDSTWTYEGTPYISMSTELKEGLNMVGWLNCSKPISDALSSIDSNYWYVARWNAAMQGFEVYNPAAPSVFNDFNAMERGAGYFISIRESSILSESY